MSGDAPIVLRCAFAGRTARYDLPGIVGFPRASWRLSNEGLRLIAKVRKAGGHCKYPKIQMDLEGLLPPPRMGSVVASNRLAGRPSSAVTLSNLHGGLKKSG